MIHSWAVQTIADMTAVSLQHLTSAVLRVQHLSLQQRADLADQIYAHQPNLLLSVIALHRFDCSLAEIEVVLNLLLVLYEAMKATGKAWPVISEDDQDRCLDRISGRLRFSEGLTPPQRTRLISDAVAGHPEPALLAYLVSTLKAQGLAEITTEPRKMLVLVAFNLVECIAYAAP